MLNLIRSEIFRLRRRWMPAILLLVMALIMVGLYGVFWTVLYAAEQSSDPEAALTARDMREVLSPASINDLGLNVTQSVGTVMVIILTASTVASEFGWGTLRTILPRTSGRRPFIAAKLITTIMFAALVVLVGIGVSVLASFGISTVEDLPRDLGQDSPASLFGSSLLTFVVVLPYLALAFVLALWFRSTAAGIGISLPVLFLEGIISAVLQSLGGVWERIGDLLLSTNVSALLAVNASAEDLPADLTDPWLAALILAVYSGVFVGLAFWRFETRDITSG